MISVMDDLITDYTASGIKGAGIWDRVNYGTREINNVLLTEKGHRHSKVLCVIGGGLSRSSEDDC